ncbi:probable bifunctional dTTP/UTP pyrophosphatase/methyltransferase protein [Pseudoliparis swirei]|uniref:probable bifunctional dTTP/UTP pyrophosphatase/methyltransferase protein n=1 Tax=Pseudoliparis swirei TaxID=2059687 RepID=UPI0024BEC648|nr:probable bifunctional dTTP/UTP pyrophosphatase/methyltransferase protein [Pseudoliparis swirei]
MVLNPVISKLAGKLVVLASASPRRLEILSNVGLRFEVVPSWFKETLDKGLFKEPHEYAVETAKQKALEVARRMPVKHLKTPDIVIGADTIVTVDGVILEKPVDKADAYRMLSLLSGKEHSVFTGVAIVFCHKKENEEVDYQLVEFYEETKVKFSDLSDDMLWEYINSGEPMDKAGGYGIQALGGMLVEYVHGDFLNVVGFPLNRFFKQLDLIYNQSASSPGREGGSARPSHSGAPANSPLVLPAHSGLRPTAGPLPEVERKGSEHEANGSSKHLEDREAQTGASENATLPPMTSRGPSEPKKEDMQRIIDLMDGFKASKALFTASKMCVFDLLQSRPGLEAAQVAREVNASVRGTECLLEACVSLGLLRSKEGRCQKPVFENTDLSAHYLLTDAPRSLRGHIARCDDTAWPLFSRLDSAVREGASQREKAFSKTTEDTLQETFHNSQEDKLGFMNAMHSMAQVTGRAVATAFDLSRFKTACDLGGCTGAMAYEFTKAHPGFSVTVFDLPAVVELSERFHPLHTDNRVSFVAGDFFEDELPKADLYILARILHDLPEEKVHILLSKIAEACTPGCGLLLSEIFLDEDRGGPARGLLQALGMSEGRQRSAAEYALLLESHGFVTARGVHTGGLLDAMLCLKA